MDRSYCRRERRETSWRPDGFVNSAIPRADHYVCLSCGFRRLSLGPTVQDAEGLCRAVLDGWLRSRASGVGSAAEGEPLSTDRLDLDDALAHLLAEVWAAYLAYHPGRGSVLGWTTFKLRHALSDWLRTATGYDSRKVEPRPLDLPFSEFEAEDGELGGPLATLSADLEGDRDPDLAETLVRGGRGLAVEPLVRGGGGLPPGEPRSDRRPPAARSGNGRVGVGSDARAA